MTIRDRIVELRRVPARELLRNPKNWRRHPKAQSDALKALVQEIGVADVLLCRPTPAGLELIDGHLRADTLPDEDLPVIVLDLNQEEADKLLATLDPLAAMALTDPASLRDLMASVQWSSAELGALLQPLWPAPGAATGHAGALRADFLEPPFSVLDARSGTWQARGAFWRGLGLQSELGRDAVPGGAGANAAYRDKGAGFRAAMGTGAPDDLNGQYDHNTARRKHNRVSPGGSPRPAARFAPGGGTIRGDGHGRPLT